MRGFAVAGELRNTRDVAASDVQQEKKSGWGAGNKEWCLGNATSSSSGGAQWLSLLVDVSFKKSPLLSLFARDLFVRVEGTIVDDVLAKLLLGRKDGNYRWHLCK